MEQDDDDVVDESNLQRQIVHSTDAVGTPKVESAHKRVAQINPHVSVVTHQTRIDAANALELLRPYDVVIDGSDNFPTRYLVNDACVILGKPLIYGAIQKFEGQVSVFNYKGGPNYRDLFPEPPPPGEVPSCAEGGVLGVLPGVIGCMQATEAIKVCLGVEEGTLSGRLLIYDAMRMRFHEVKLAPRSDSTCRAIVVNKNQPGALAAMTAVFSSARINVLQQVNASRGDIAYNVIDLAKPDDLAPDDWREMQRELTMVDSVI